jgi:hypothetical protein
VKRFALLRTKDLSGISGTGVVALGIELDNKQAVLAWRGPEGAIGIYPSIARVEAVHGHDGATRIVWIDANAPFEAQLREAG